jgi:hypothetical protein
MKRRLSFDDKPILVLDPDYCVDVHADHMRSVTQSLS